MATVLKLTQVGKERILRRSREPSLRNSAKILRNFGIRSAFLTEVLTEVEKVAVKKVWATVY